MAIVDNPSAAAPQTRAPGTYRSRRAKGEGSIGPWKGGTRWRVRVTERGKTKAWVFTTKQGAAAHLRAVQQQRAEGLAVLTMSPGRKLNAWLDEWLISVRLGHPRTARTYESWARHIRAGLGDYQLRELSASVLLQFFASGLSPKLAPESRRHVYQVLSAALNSAVRRGLIGRNPLADVPKPPGAELERPTLTVDECKRLLDVSAEDGLGALVLLALHTGARQGELLALTWDDIDFDEGTMSITKSLKEVRGAGLQAGPTKTRNGRRVIGLAPDIVEEIRRHRTRQSEERLSAHGNWSGDLVFTTAAGTPISRSNFTRRYWHPLLSRAALPPIHFHDLRHTAALLMMRNGQLVAVSRRLGHSSTAVTTELYGHATRIDDDQIVHGVAATLARPVYSSAPAGVVLHPRHGWGVEPAAQPGDKGVTRE